MNENIKYIALGLTSFATFAIVSYLSPFTAVMVFAMIIALGMSYVIGFVILDTCNLWMPNEQNKSRKKTPPSKDA